MLTLFREERQKKKEKIPPFMIWTAGKSKKGRRAADLKKDETLRRQERNKDDLPRVERRDFNEESSQRDMRSKE